MKLTTTLNRIRALSSIPESIHILIAFLGPDQAKNPDAEIDLRTVLDSNGVIDTIWALQSAVQDPCGVAVRIALAMADKAVPMVERRDPKDVHTRRAVSAAKRWLDGEEPDKYVVFAANRSAFDLACKGWRDASRAAEVVAYAVNAAYGIHTGRDIKHVVECAAAAADALDAAGYDLSAYRDTLRDLLS